MKFPSIRQTAAQSPTIQDLIECVEILTGRRRNREIDYGTIDGVRTKALDIAPSQYGRIKARAYRNGASIAEHNRRFSSTPSASTQRVLWI